MRAPAPVHPATLLHHLPVERGCTVVRDGPVTVVGAAPAAVRHADGASAFEVLREVDAGGFWAGYCAYDLGRAIEQVRPRASGTGGAADPLAGALPDVAFARYDARIVLSAAGEVLDIVGGRRDRARLGRAVRAAGRDPGPAPAAAATRAGVRPGTASRSWSSSMDRVDHAAACAHVLALLEAGDCYQVNVTRRLTAAAGAGTDAATVAVGLAAALADVNPAPHAALCTFGPALPGVAIVSASPELFLRVAPGPGGRRTVETGPIKGTAPDAQQLATSAKDRAENVMIVDLARNDLGRVCEFGSVRVERLCAVETHPGLHHLVSAVTGVLRDDVDLAGLVRATFPPASVTGAPKPRVMQAIEDVEPVRRGVYCGAVGWVDADRDRLELAVAIRTFVLARGRLTLGVGGGIVADSRPEAEWAETELKAARLLAAAGTGTTPREAAVAAGTP